VIGLAGLLAAPLGDAQAATVYSQTPIIDAGQRSDRDTNNRTADDFTLAGNETVVSVTWRGLYIGLDNTAPGSDDFNVNFYADDGGGVPDLPGVLLQSFAVGNAVNRTDTGQVVDGSTVFEYTADLGAGIALNGGTLYHLSISGDTSGDVFNSSSNDSGASWTQGLRRPYFTLANAPEPSLVLLLGLAGAAVLIRRSRLG
jgi:hypothetical protein